MEYRGAREDKRRLAEELFHRLREHYAPHGLTHFGQGKWYPGEPLPRWSLNCFWRRDGVPHLGHSGAAGRRIGRLRGAGRRRPGAFSPASPRRSVWRRHLHVRCLRGCLLLPVARAAPAFERRSLNSRLSDPQERARLARVFEQGLERVAGFVLPLSRDSAGTQWQTSRWFLRDERCYLMPGDSPLGYRLPLDSLPWVAPVDYPHVHPPDPNQVFPPLPEGRAAAQSHGGAPLAACADRGRSIRRVRSRAPQCAPSRARACCTFSCHPYPGSRTTSSFVAVIEDTARALSQPVLIEGYEPPQDPRLAGFRVTPDPGVIEVNIHPSASWEELSERTSFLYEAGAAVTADLGEVHAGRPAHRHRRWQSLRARCRECCGLALPAPSGSAAQPALVLAQPPIAVLSVLGHVPRPHVPGAAHR